MNKNNEIHIEEIQEILEKPPLWLIRWGITIIALIILFVYFISAFIKYPDVVEGEVILTTSNPPIKLSAKSNGMIKKILKKETDVVKKGDFVAEIQSSVAIEDIDKLNSFLKEVKKSLNERYFLSDPLDSNRNFGELQLSYNQLIKTMFQYQLVISDDYYENMINQTNEQIERYKSLRNITEEQFTVSQKELENMNKKYDVNKILYEKDGISKHELYSFESELNSKKMITKDIQKLITQQSISITDLELQKLNKEKEWSDNKNSLVVEIKSQIDKIEAEIELWEQQYVIVAPIDGKLLFLSELFENKTVSSEEDLMAIIPQNELYVGQMQISTKGRGNVKRGQKVLMSLENYPSNDFGKLEGKVLNVSQIPNDQMYRVNIVLSNPLITTYKKPIKYMPEMSGSGEIITEDVSVLQRFFHKFKNLTSEL